MLQIAGLIDPACAAMDPIDVFGAMAGAGSRIACAPLIYGYVSDAVPGFRPRHLASGDLPVLGSAGPVGSALGGTGLPSRHFPRPAAGHRLAYRLAGADPQRDPHAHSGGQPGPAAAWQDPAASASFYPATRATLEAARLRPRHDGSMAFQATAAARLTAARFRRDAAQTAIVDINRLFRNSFRAGQHEAIGRIR